MLQPIRRQARVPFLTLVAVALAALATLVSISLARITTSSATRNEAAISTLVRTDVVSVERPVVPAPTDKTGCSTATYVSGDLAGDASPTEVYAAMCAKP
jgi:hypothetical protein